MENGFGQTIIQVDNEPAILQLAQEAAQELTTPWRQSSPHSHQGQGAVERFQKPLFAQCRAIRFDWVERYNFNHLTAFLSNYFLGCYKSAIFGENVLADIKRIAI
eukprot:373673-Amphidinium_carterae.2